MDKANALVAEIKRGNPRPIYLLFGEEPYYIDKISQFIADNVLDADQRDFNQMVIYGKDSSIEEVISQAKRYPMMAERQVLILKEAQHLHRTIDQLLPYAENPQPTTVLVLCYKYLKVDKRKKFFKAIEKNGMVFESPRMYEDRVGAWIGKLMAGKQYRITPKSCAILVEYLGNDLSRIENEMDKLIQFVPPGSEITPELIEKHIGISKEYNNFELKKALGERDVKKAARIIEYFAQNPKDNPLVVTIAQLQTFFSQLLQYHGLADHSKGNVAKALKINPFFVQEYVIAAKNYPMKRVSGIISSLRILDLRSKGVGANRLSQADLLKELLIALV